MDENIAGDDPLAYWRGQAKKLVKKDPYAIGVTHGGQHVKNVARAINTILHSEKCNKVTIEVELAEDDYHISFTVKDKR